MSITWTTDTGKVEGVATIEPKALHGAMADAVIEGLRTGIPGEWLDAVHAWNLDGSLGAIGSSDEMRREHLQREIDEGWRRERNARRNANNVDDDELADEFLADAQRARADVQRAEDEMAELDAAKTGTFGPAQFEAEVDFFAHACANLARIDGPVDPPLASEIGRLFEITSVDPGNYPSVHFEFFVNVPALGRVVRLGPLRCSVQSRAYPATLPDDVRAAPKTVAELIGREHSDGRHAVDDVRAALKGHGWNERAAGVCANASLRPLFDVLLHVLGDKALPDGVSAAYTARVCEIYGRVNFAWKPGKHFIDTTKRQLLLDTVIGAGGHMGMREAEAALLPELNRMQIANFTLPQHAGKSPLWLPCVVRTGDWTKGRPMESHGVAAVDCPHCGGWADLVVRVPEIPECLLCSSCLRAPSPESPVYPVEYLALRCGPPVAAP